MFNLGHRADLIQIIWSHFNTSHLSFAIIMFFTDCRLSFHVSC